MISRCVHFEINPRCEICYEECQWENVVGYCHKQTQMKYYLYLQAIKCELMHKDFSMLKYLFVNAVLKEIDGNFWKILLRECKDKQHFLMIYLLKRCTTKLPCHRQYYKVKQNGIRENIECVVPFSCRFETEIAVLLSSVENDISHYFQGFHYRDSQTKAFLTYCSQIYSKFICDVIVESIIAQSEALQVLHLRIAVNMSCIPFQITPKVFWHSRDDGGGAKIIDLMLLHLQSALNMSTPDIIKIKYRIKSKTLCDDEDEKKTEMNSTLSDDKVEDTDSDQKIDFTPNAECSISCDGDLSLCTAIPRLLSILRGEVSQSDSRLGLYAFRHCRKHHKREDVLKYLIQNGISLHAANSDECSHFKRHFRDRSQDSLTSPFERRGVDVFLESIRDQIHCHYFHADEKDLQTAFEKTQSAKQSNKFLINDFWNEISQKEEESKDEKVYSFGTRNINDCWGIIPPFDDLKSEITSKRDNRWGIDEDQWISHLLCFCKRFYRDPDIGRRVYLYGDTNGGIVDEHFNILGLYYHRMSLLHIVSIKLYTDFDDLQRDFRSRFRNEQTSLLRFYHWANILYDACNTFGEEYRYTSHAASLKYEMKQNKCEPLFHGINEKMLMDLFKHMHFGPLSLTPSRRIAQQFAKSDGIILQIGNSWPNCPLRLLDVSDISCFDNEREVVSFNNVMDIMSVIESNYALDDDRIQNNKRWIQGLQCFNNMYLTPGVKMIGVDSREESIEFSALQYLKYRCFQSYNEQIPQYCLKSFDKMCDDCNVFGMGNFTNTEMLQFFSDVDEKNIRIPLLSRIVKLFPKMYRLQIDTAQCCPSIRLLKSIQMLISSFGERQQVLHLKEISFTTGTNLFYTDTVEYLMLKGFRDAQRMQMAFEFGVEEISGRQYIKCLIFTYR